MDGGDRSRRGGVLSHATAARAWGLRPPGAGAIHVTVSGDAGRKRRAGIRLHRSATLGPDETTTVRGIPITTPVRTIIDLAATLRGRPLEQALDLAEHRRLVDFAELRRSKPTRPAGIALPTSAVVPLHGRHLRDPQRDGGALPRAVRQPRPAAAHDVNTRIEGVEVDFVWRDARLIVEVDGYGYHRSPSAFEADRERDVMLVVAGWQVLRFTWTQITRRPAWVARAVANRLTRSARYAGRKRQRVECG